MEGGYDGRLPSVTYFNKKGELNNEGGSVVEWLGRRT